MHHDNISCERPVKYSLVTVGSSQAIKDLSDSNWLY